MALQTKKKNMINVLQAWRAIMMGMIFILHVCPDVLPFLSGGYETISFFIIVSGFVLTLNFKGSDELSLKNIFNFTKKRIKKFYPLYMMALIASFLVLLISAIKVGTKEVFDLIFKFILDTLMIQSFIPVESFYFSINGVSWYLSATLFFYFMFIPLFNFYKKFSLKKCICFIFLNIVIFCAFIFVLQNSSNFSYLTYIFPVFRLLEFSIGILLARIVNRPSKVVRESVAKSIATLFELAVIILFIAERYWLRIYSGNHDYQSIVGMLTAVLIVFVFSFEKGFISKILSNKLFVFIGNISFEIFIIHNTVKLYISTIAGVFDVKLPIVVLTLTITLIGAALLHYKPYKLLNKKLG